ncbi:MAG: BON domain-containing protein [Betaproteobacteria bacterium]
MRILRHFGSLLLLTLLPVLPPAVAGDMIQLDPFAQATRGYPGCLAQAPPLLTQEQASAQAHVRVERGLRCAMEGKCEPGGAYKRDPETNERMRTLIAGDPRFATTSVWVTTSRNWVTLQGCVHTATQRTALVAFVAMQPGVERVFDELRTGVRPAPK